MRAPSGSNLVTCCASVFVCDWTLSGPLRALWPPWLRRALSPLLALRSETLCLHPTPPMPPVPALIHGGGHLVSFSGSGMSWLIGIGGRHPTESNRGDVRERQNQEPHPGSSKSLAGFLTP